MQRAGRILRAFGTEVIYGTIRSILRDTTSFLPWAKDDFACVIFNLRTPHDAAGLLRTANTFRALIDTSIELRGSFFLTYHRAAIGGTSGRLLPRLPRSGLRRSWSTTQSSGLRAPGTRTTEMHLPVRIHAEGRSLEQHFEAHCRKHHLAGQRSTNCSACCSRCGAVVPDLSINQCQGSSARRKCGLATDALDVATFRTTRATRHRRALLAPQALDRKVLP